MGTFAKEKYTYTMAQSWKMLGWLLATQILVAFVGRSLSPLGVLIGEDLMLTKTQIGMLPAALFFGQALVSLPAGFLTDRIGTKRMLLLVAGALGGGFILMTVTSMFTLVLLLIALGGLGYGASHPAANRGIITWFPAQKRGLAMGIKQMGVTFGSALAALLLLPVASVWGWRPALLGASLLLIVVGSLAYFFYKERPMNEEQETDVVAEPTHFFSEIMKMAKHKALVLVSLSAMLLNGSQMILNTYIVLFAYEKLGLSLVLAGILLVVSEIGGSSGRIIWGIISDRLFHSKRIIILVIISVFTAIISGLVAFLPAHTSFITMIPIIFAFGFCISGFNAIWMNATTEIVPGKQSGIATGFSLTIGSLGVIIGPPLFGMIVDMTGTYTMGWLFMSTMMVIVMFLLLGAMAVVKKKA